MTRVLALMINFVAYLMFFCSRASRIFVFRICLCFYFVIMRTTVTISNLVQKAAESAKERERERGEKVKAAREAAAQEFHF